MMPKFLQAVVATLFARGKNPPLSFVPAELHPVLEKAALEYAAMSPSEFKDGVMYVGSTRLRSIGLIDAQVWAKVPANDNVRVSKQPDGSLRAVVLLAG